MDFIYFFELFKYGAQFPELCPSGVEVAKMLCVWALYKRSSKNAYFKMYSLRLSFKVF